MASLVDTNILVYRCDPRSPEKQRLARELLHRGLSGHELVLRPASLDGGLMPRAV